MVEVSNSLNLAQSEYDLHLAVDECLFGISSASDCLWLQFQPQIQALHQIMSQSIPKQNRSGFVHPAHQQPVQPPIARQGIRPLYSSGSLFLFLFSVRGPHTLLPGAYPRAGRGQDFFRALLCDPTVFWWNGTE